MRYIGSKTATLPWLTAFIAERAPEARSLCDPFAGTCTVARHFKQLGFQVTTGDVLSLSYVIQVATIGLNGFPAFRKLQHIDGIRRRKEPIAADRALGHLNSLRARKRYLSEHFSAKSGLAPLPGEPIIPPNGPNKFLPVDPEFNKYSDFDLEKVLKDHGIRTVITVGTQVQTAVLHTASEAALRGYKVIVPVDGMSGDSLYPEQYTAWHLTNTLRIKQQVTLTRVDLVSY
jgi:nicotinamidase-related amidase